jgi:ribosome-associated protein
LQDTNKTAVKNTTTIHNQDSANIKDIIVAGIEDAKGNDITVIEVSHLTQITDYMIIVTGTSNRHIQTIAETTIKKAHAHAIEKIGIEGLGKSEWVVVDFADVVLHVMSPAAREHYNIEGLWDINPEQA